jgi:3-oxoacyl-[acyl-carrier protein] reductase
MNLAGKVALVTGAGAGIGRAAALRLAHDGAAVVAGDVDAHRGRETALLIHRLSGRAACLTADVAVEDEVRALVRAAEETFGGLDILINNAGVVEALTTQLVAFPNVEPARWQRMLQVNLHGVILATQLGLEAMRRRGGGAVVNVATAAGIGYGPHDAPVYAAARAAVVRFSSALAWLAPAAGVRVNCICPGWVHTSMTERARAETPPAQWRKLAPAEMLAPEDIADAIVELVCADALAGRVLVYLTPGGPRRILPAGEECLD